MEFTLVSHHLNMIQSFHSRILNSSESRWYYEIEIQRIKAKWKRKEKLTRFMDSKQEQNKGEKGFNIKLVSEIKHQWLKSLIVCAWTKGKGIEANARTHQIQDLVQTGIEYSFPLFWFAMLRSKSSSPYVLRVLCDNSEKKLQLDKWEWCKDRLRARCRLRVLYPRFPRISEEWMDLYALNFCYEMHLKFTPNSLEMQKFVGDKNRFWVGYEFWFSSVYSVWLYPLAYGGPSHFTYC